MSDRRHDDEGLAAHGGIGALGPVAIYQGMTAGNSLAENWGRPALAVILGARGQAAARQLADETRQLAEEIGMTLVARRTAWLVHD